MNASKLLNVLSIAALVALTACKGDILEPTNIVGQEDPAIEVNPGDIYNGDEFQADQCAMMNFTNKIRRLVKDKDGNLKSDQAGTIANATFNQIIYDGAGWEISGSAIATQIPFQIPYDYVQPWNTFFPLYTSPALMAYSQMDLYITNLTVDYSPTSSYVYDQYDTGTLFPCFYIYNIMLYNASYTGNYRLAAPKGIEITQARKVTEAAPKNLKDMPVRKTDAGSFSVAVSKVNLIELAISEATKAGKKLAFNTSKEFMDLLKAPANTLSPQQTASMKIVKSGLNATRAKVNAIFAKSERNVAKVRLSKEFKNLPAEVQASVIQLYDFSQSVN